MANAYITTFNHNSLDGISEIAGLLRNEFQRCGFRATTCRLIPEQVNAEDVLVVVDEFSEPLVIEALTRFRTAHPNVTMVCVLSEFFSARTWLRPPSLNSFKQPLSSLLLDNLLYVYCHFSGHIKLFSGLKIRPPGPAHFALGALGLIWLGLQKLRKPRTPIVNFRIFHERGYLWFRALGLQSINGIFDFFLTLHPEIASNALAASVGTIPEKIYSLLIPPPVFEKPHLINSRLKFGIDFSGSLTPYRKKQLKAIIRKMETLSPGRRFAVHTARGFDDSKIKYLLSYNPPQSATWRYSSPMRIIGAIKRGQIPLLLETYGDHPSEELALVIPSDLEAARHLLATLIFDRSRYIDSAWEKLQNYRVVAENNNREIIIRLRESRAPNERKNSTS